ncbi:Copia protein [Rhynchospora pubera]|uniref:Copia protein n=1 Tax=Rhynchospora pubera TaxID=906938 RepID=A0AAV8FC15_9POAL|nr:Copia protein [Rhynchospora pubera]
MASTASELMWIKQLLADLNKEHEAPMKMFCDNQAARHIAANHLFHERTKHIEVDCHFIREKIQLKQIETRFVKSEDQLADIFTKGLSMKACENISCKLGLYDIYNPNLRGSVEK